MRPFPTEVPMRLIGLAVVLALGLLAPLAGEAQRTGKVWRIGVLSGSPPTTPEAARPWEALFAGLRDLGYVEGQNLTVERRWAEGRAERYHELAAELVALKLHGDWHPARALRGERARGLRRRPRCEGGGARRSADRASRPVGVQSPASHRGVRPQERDSDRGRLRVRRGGLSHVVRLHLVRRVSTSRKLCRQNLEGCQARRSPDRASKQVRAGHQPQDRQGAWAKDPA